MYSWTDSMVSYEYIKPVWEHFSNGLQMCYRLLYRLECRVVRKEQNNRTSGV